MTPEDDLYFNNYFDLFLTDGWKQFVEEVITASSSINVRSISDEKELRYVQGQLNIVDNVTNWEASILNAYDSAMEAQVD